MNNLDDESDEGLRAIAGHDDDPDIREYARTVLEARTLRKRGRIEKALRKERWLDQLYWFLPADRRW